MYNQPLSKGAAFCVVNAYYLCFCVILVYFALCAGFKGKSV